MKIGILTFHSQINYGGVLQCWALQTALEKMGHEVVVIDRWLSDDNYMLERGYDKFGVKEWMKFAVRAPLWLGDMSEWLRVWRTKKFLRRNLKRTPYYFVEWNAAPKDIGVDMVVVGSDQVWHCGDFGDPRVYLLEGAPEMPAIAYAASFGMAELPKALGAGASGAEDCAAEPVYKRGLARFNAISCREKEGVAICRDLGYDAAHVVDPTLLAWGEGAAEHSKEEKKRELVCYFLSEKIEDHFDELDAFARNQRCKVKVFLNDACFEVAPSNLARFKNMLRVWKRRLSKRVKIMDSAGPAEFYRAFKTARWVVSDSYHALMFSICNGCEARMLRPESQMRRSMFGRIEEFAEHANGSLIVESVAGALDSFAKGGKVDFDYEWIDTRRQESLRWLKIAVAVGFSGRDGVPPPSATSSRTRTCNLN